MRIPLALCALPAVAACSLLSPAPPPAPPPVLGYGVPAPPAATYVHSDSALLQVDAGGRTVDVTVASRSVLDFEFERGMNGAVRASAVYREFEGRSSNPLGSPEIASVDDISGALVFDIDAVGETEFVRAPGVEGSARTFVRPEMLAASFFPKLPGRAVQEGERWTDTTTVTSEWDSGTVRATSITTYTAAGDTLVGAATYLLVRMSGPDTRMVRESQEGIELAQEVSGSQNGWFLWDRERRLPVEIVSTTTHTGTMEVSGAPFPMGVRVESRARTVLQER